MMQEYRLRNNYHALRNNCTTICVAGFQRGTGRNLYDESLNTGRSLSFTERTAARFSGWPNHFFMPADLGAYLTNKAASFGIRTQTYSSQSGNK